MTAIAWFRRDLRLHDNPALLAALASGGGVLPLYVFDRRLMEGARWASPNRAWFLVESLRALDALLRDRGSRLHVRTGNPTAEVVRAARESGAEAVFVSRDYTPFGRRRDAAVSAALAAIGVRFEALPGVLAVEPEAIAASDGGPIRVFTPFKRRWEEAVPREPLGVPGHIPTPAFEPGHWPAAPATAALHLPEPGEAAARAHLASWAASGLDAYATVRDRPDLDRTSHLSIALRWGLLSPAEVLSRTAGPGESRARFRAEVAWRDFFAHLLWHIPALRREPLQRRFAGVPWRDAPGDLEDWKAGRTGYPFVDAAMRQLAATGWMHNRLRMVTAAFLTKHLLIHWSEGERFFMEHLFDGDVASNNGGWQWAASTGADAQPYFRIFNPILQSRKFDPEGAFIRRWLPELERVPGALIHEPWRMTPMEQREADCVIGEDYPPPIVNHAEARARALAAFECTRV